MHGEYDRKLGPRLFLTVFHSAVIVAAGWLLIGGGLEALRVHFGVAWRLVSPLRREMLFGCACIYFLRINLTIFYLMKRRMGWGEAVLISAWTGFIHLWFAYLGGTNSRAAGPITTVGALLYVLGSCLNTGSELKRRGWKDLPGNEARLYTGGLFHYSQHVNYFGDELLFTGYAVITGSAWSAVVPILMCAGFVFFSIPDLNRHLRKHYGAEFEDYARRTRKFVPFVY